VEEAVRRVRESFRLADYTVEGVEALLGPAAHAALARGETVPARRATHTGGPLATLVRLFLLQQPVPEESAQAALPLAAAAELGLVASSGGDVVARLDVRPYAPDDAPPGDPWWVVSDLDHGLDGVRRPLPGDHVLGVGGASATLAQLTPRPPVERALDVGTGCGVQALHLTRHAGQVTATDVLPRALTLAELTGRLSGVDLDLRAGSLYEPVAAERFGLVVTNPPFVVHAPSTRTYRDSGLHGDEVSRRLVHGHRASSSTAAGSSCWPTGCTAEARTGATASAGWLPERGVQAHVVQRDVEDPAAYVATWLRDAGERGSPAYLEAYDAWLAALEQAGGRGRRLRLVCSSSTRQTARRTRRSRTGRTPSSSRWAHTCSPSSAAADGWAGRATATCSRRT
jgi:methylase of polypeptide subunit release factors